MDFLHSKVCIAPDSGFEIDVADLHSALKPHQKDAVMWALKGGRRALFEKFGLGKTVQELEFCYQSVKHEGRQAIDCPADFDIDTKECKNFKQADIVKIGWSGGKDSTCAVMKHIERRDKLKIVCWIPMLTKEIPLILKDHYEFIIKTANYFRSLGAEVYFADGGLTYYEYVTHIAKSGKYKGQIFGFPCINRGQCGFKRDGKLRACDRCDVGEFDYLSIGIAFDEIARHNQLTEEKRSILCELEITEQMATDFCKERNLYSPHYSYDFGKKRKKHRDGCSLCAHATQAEREQYFRDYPEAIPIVIELQNIVKEKRPDRAPLRGYKWFIEN